MSENPLSPDLPPLLSQVLLILEGIRRDLPGTDRDWDEAREALEEFDRQQANLVHRQIASQVQEAVDQARSAVQERQVEEAREAMIRVGQILDTWLRGER